METFGQYLAEAQEINLAMKAFKQLSYEARDALNGWESSSWRTGNLQQAYKNHTDLMQEFEVAMQPIRAYLRSKYGPTIKLYRGLYKDPHWKQENYDPILTSWTTDRRVAEIFAGYRRSNTKALSKPLPLYKVLSQAEIDVAVAQYDRIGYVKVGRHAYKRNKQNPKYYDIYDGNEIITDGDDLRASLEKDARENKQYNDDKLSKGIILDKNISVDKIVWILNGLNCKEFIVRNA